MKGQVVEESSREALYGATISLRQGTDSTFVSGVICDTLGYFQFDSIKPDDYTLRLSFIGFVSKTIPLSISKKDLDLGKIELRISDIFLESVEITGQQSMIVKELDKTVYNVQRDLLSETSSLSEVLQNIPSVSVDINGAVTLRNSANITYFINGKPSAMLRRNPSAILEQIPASSIDRVEIITNPSAKYRPDGIGGIINIVLKKDDTEGLAGQIGLYGGTENRYNGNVNLNYNKEDFGLYGNYGFRHSAGIYLFGDSRLFKNPVNQHSTGSYQETGKSKIDALAHNFLLGMNYDLNDQSSLELSGTYYLQNSLHKNEAEIAGLDSSEGPDYFFTNHQINDEFEEEGEVNLAFEHIFKNNEDHTISFESAYSAFNEREDLEYLQQFQFPNNDLQVLNNLIQKSGYQIEVILDHAIPVGEDGELESGYNGERVHEDIRYDLSGNSSQFQFDQEIHAIYTLFNKSYEKVSFKIGLRAEWTQIKSQLLAPVDSLLPNKYFKLFPTLHLGYELDDNKNISLSYSKRLNRPDADELNPNPEFSDPRNAESGNPDIRPEQIHSIELAHQVIGKERSLTTTLYYRYKYDAFTSIQNSIGDSIVLTTIANLNTRQSGGAEVVLSNQINKNWKLDLTGNVYLTAIDASDLGFSGQKTAISGNIKGFTTYKFKRGLSAQLNFYYYFPYITPQGQREAYYYMNAGLKKELLKKRAAISITATDILYTYQVNRSFDSDEIDQQTSIRRKQPVVFVGFIWKFNNFKSKEDLNYEGEGLRR
ncbi:MAG: TonB-dependent receptor [Vicingaceae bacterium]